MSRESFYLDHTRRWNFPRTSWWSTSGSDLSDRFEQRYRVRLFLWGKMLSTLISRTKPIARVRSPTYYPIEM